MDRQSRIIVGGLVGLLLIAFVLVGPGRAWAESMLDGDNPALADGPVSEEDYVATPPPVRAPQVIRLDDRPVIGTTSPDPLADDPLAGPPPRPRAVAPQNRAGMAQGGPSAAQREQRARDLSGLEDGDLSTTGDLAF